MSCGLTAILVFIPLQINMHIFRNGLFSSDRIHALNVLIRVRPGKLKFSKNVASDKYLPVQVLT
jgi:hypothetical protein